MSAVFLPADPAISSEDRYAELEVSFGQCDVVVVEGDSQTTAPRIEVWRAELGTEPLASGDASIRAVITDDPLSVDTTIRPRSNVQDLASWVLTSILGM